MLAIKYCDLVMKTQTRSCLANIEIVKLCKSNNFFAFHFHLALQCLLFILHQLQKFCSAKPDKFLCFNYVEKRLAEIGLRPKSLACMANGLLSRNCSLIACFRYVAAHEWGLENFFLSFLFAEFQVEVPGELEHFFSSFSRLFLMFMKQQTQREKYFDKTLNNR